LVFGFVFVLVIALVLGFDDGDAATGAGGGATADALGSMGAGTVDAVGVGVGVGDADTVDDVEPTETQMKGESSASHCWYPPLAGSSRPVVSHRMSSTSQPSATTGADDVW
jgi:hypothetical protein